MPKLLVLQHRYCAITYQLRYVDIPYVPVPSNIDLLPIVYWQTIDIFLTTQHN